MRGQGFTVEEIATFLAVSRQTVHTHYQAELDRGKIATDVSVTRALFNNATKNNNVTAQIWWTKARMGWHEKMAIEASGPNGGPIQRAEVDDPALAHLTDDELLLMQEMKRTAQQRMRASERNGDQEPNEE